MVLTRRYPNIHYGFSSANLVISLLILEGKMKKKLIVVIAALSMNSAFAMSKAPALESEGAKHYPEFNIHETTLGNGLKVVVKEDNRAPVMTSQVWYKVGSSYEHNGITGVSHVLEHMMFKGTKTRGPNEFSKIIAENGGKENAFTGRDYTAYFQTMEKSRLPISMELEADRMRSLALSEDEFKKEVQVVMEERRMRTEDNPQALTYEQFNATAYVNSPYQHPVIGWMDDLMNMELQDLAEWYRKWYAPNNATLVIVGDVDHKEVFALAEKFFGPLKPSDITPPKPRVEVAQKGERRVVVRAPAQVPYFAMGYKVPSVVNAEHDWEPYALDVLSTVLDGGNSARFSKHLVREQQVANSVGAGYDAFTPGQEIFMFSGTPAQGKTVADLEAAIQQQIELMKKEKVTQDELDRVKAQVIASKVYEKDSIFYQAMNIGMMETVKLGWPLGEEYDEKIKAVTADQIMEVAKKYLISDSLTVAVLEPVALDKTAMKR